MEAVVSRGGRLDGTASYLAATIWRTTPTRHACAGFSGLRRCAAGTVPRHRKPSPPLTHWRMPPRDAAASVWEERDAGVVKLGPSERSVAATGRVEVSTPDVELTRPIQPPILDSVVDV